MPLARMLRCVNCVCCLHQLGCTCKSTCGTISANPHQQQHMKMHSSTQLGPERHCKTQAESAAQTNRKQQLGMDNKLANTLPDALLAPHITVCGPSTTPGMLQLAGFTNNHRRHIRHQQQRKHRHTRREQQQTHQVHQSRYTTQAISLKQAAGVPRPHAPSRSSTLPASPCM